MHTESRGLKRSRYVDAARQILERDGLDALTMQALANEVGAAVGTIYGYFPSKGALVVELQMQAVSTIISAWRNASTVWSGALSQRGLTGPELALAEVVSFGEFFLAIQEDFALEFDLNRTHLEEGRDVFETVDLTAIRPSASELVEGPAERDRSRHPGRRAAGGPIGDPRPRADAAAGPVRHLAAGGASTRHLGDAGARAQPTDGAGPRAGLGCRRGGARPSHPRWCARS